MDHGHHIVVVDDDPAIRDLVGDYLDSQGFETSRAADSGAMKRALAAKAADLVILDLQLGGENGLDVLREMKVEERVPVVIITGHGIEEADRRVGIELGAHDYIVKPFGLRQMLARLRAVLERAENARLSAGRWKDCSIYGFAGWQLAMGGRCLTSPDGSVARLGMEEFNILAELVRSPGHVLTRDRLVEASRRNEVEGLGRSIDVQLLRLRRKLETDPTEPAIIQTRPGIGYVLSVPVHVVRNVPCRRQED